MVLEFVVLIAVPVVVDGVVVVNRLRRERSHHRFRYLFGSHLRHQARFDNQRWHWVRFESHRQSARDSFRESPGQESFRESASTGTVSRMTVGTGFITNHTTEESLGICGRLHVLRAVLREMPQLSTLETAGANKEIIHLYPACRLVSPASVETITPQLQLNLLTVFRATALASLLG